MHYQGPSEPEIYDPPEPMDIESGEGEVVTLVTMSTWEGTSRAVDLSPSNAPSDSSFGIVAYSSSSGDAKVHGAKEVRGSRGPYKNIRRTM